MKLSYFLGVFVLAGLLGVLALPSCFADEYNIVNFDIEQLINVSGVQCVELNNTPCSDSVNCTISILNESQSFIASNASMSSLGNGFRNYNTEIALNYTASWSAVVSCSNGGIQSFIIKIGEDITDWQTAMSLGWVGIIFVYAFMGFTIFSKEQWMIKTSLFITSLLIVLILINSANIITIGINTEKIMFTASIVSIITISVMFIYVFIFTFIKVIKNLRDVRKNT